MVFRSLHAKLVLHIRDRVRAGELTERGLARLAGISQPHLHNVLKGIRSLSPLAADRLLDHLNLSLSNLFSPAELQAFPPEFPQHVDIPLLRGAVGPQNTFDPHPYPGETYPIARDLLGPLTDPVLVTLAYDAQLVPYFEAGDLALISRPPISPATLDPAAQYLVRHGPSTLVRSLRTGNRRLYLVTPGTADEPRTWESLPLLGSPVMGKLAWIGRRLPVYT